MPECLWLGETRVLLVERKDDGRASVYMQCQNKTLSAEVAARLTHMAPEAGQAGVGTDPVKSRFDGLVGYVDALERKARVIAAKKAERAARKAERAAMKAERIARRTLAPTNPPKLANALEPTPSPPEATAQAAMPRPQALPAPAMPSQLPAPPPRPCPKPQRVVAQPAQSPAKPSSLRSSGRPTLDQKISYALELFWQANKC